jgi:hypothetical protein
MNGAVARTAGVERDIAELKAASERPSALSAYMVGATARMNAAMSRIATVERDIAALQAGAAPVQGNPLIRSMRSFAGALGRLLGFGATGDKLH